MTSRTESDSMGNIQISADAYWGAQTERARLNFGISPYTMPLVFQKALASVKEAAAQVHKDLGLGDAKLYEAVILAAQEVREGKHPLQFPVDVFQTGSGTSWNMNMNEVIAGRANEILGAGRGGKSPVHPNDLVNQGQSSNDVIPATLNISNIVGLKTLIPEVRRLSAAFGEKAVLWKNQVKIGRTHLQDAVPLSLGAEMSAFSRQLHLAADRLETVFPRLRELALGGTALGTGINTHPEFAPRAAQKLSQIWGETLIPAENFYEAIAARDVQTELMGALNVLAVALMKIANDLRLLSSGPRCGLGEIFLPSLQPGSSIMPGKVNPVIPEMTIQAAAHVMGKLTSVTIACQNGPLQLNIMMPLLAHETLSSLELMENTCRVFREKCVEGLEVNGPQCEAWVEQSMALVTPLNLSIGYDRAAGLAYKAVKEKKTVRQVVVEEGVLTEEEAAVILDPRKMI